jgi:hypothetical protein
VALVIALVLISAALLAPGLVVGPSLDAAVFSHIGGGLLDSVVPYLGAWDHKPPGIYLLSAGARALLGWLGPWNADWLVSTAATAAVGLAVAAALRRLDVTGVARAAAAVGATIFAGQFLLALGGGLTEPPATALVALAFVLVLAPATGWSLAVIGALVGAALVVSIQLVPGGVVVLLLGLASRPRGARWRAGIVTAAGFVLPLALVATWLVVSGALPAAVDAVIGYSTAYRSSSRDYGVILATPVAAWTVLASLFLVAPALLGAASLARATISASRRAPVFACMLWIGLSLVLFVVQGRFYAHYAIPLAVPLGVLGGIGLRGAGDSLRRARQFGQRALILSPLAATLLISIGAGVVSGAMQFSPIADESRRMDAVSERVRDIPDGTMLVWGNEPALYDLAGRAPATRYSYLYPLTTPGYSTAAMIAAVTDQLAADPPEIVVDAGSSTPGQEGFLPLLIDRPIATDGRDLDLLDPLRSFVRDRYDLAAIVAGWPIYVLRIEPAPAT